MAFQPSPEQQAIFDYVAQCRHDAGQKGLAVSALAGTGKTTTIIELVKRTPGISGIYCAFNRDIVADVEPKLKGTAVVPKTFHSMGNASLLKHIGAARANPDGNKYRTLAETWIQNNAAVQDEIGEILLAIEDADERFVKRQQINKAAISTLEGMCDWVRIKLVEWNDAPMIRAVAEKGGVIEEEIASEHKLINLLAGGVQTVMQRAETALQERASLDFTDMIYWNVRWNLNIPQYAWVFADEVQDMNPMQRAMIRKSLAPNGFLIAVGDVNQAIYAFAGADSDSFHLTVQEFKCHVLPLTVTRRCAAVIVAHAQRLVPEFKAADGVARGKLVWLDENLLATHAEPGDMVISRIKSPLVGACFDLLAAGKPATILGSDIGKALIKLLEKIAKRKGFTFADFALHLDAYMEEQVAKFRAKNDETGAENMTDQCAALQVMFDRAQPVNMEEFQQSIDRLFSKGDTLTRLLDKLVKRGGFKILSFLDYLADYEKYETPSPLLTEQCADLREIYTRAKPTTLDAFYAAINDRFKKGAGIIKLCTAHKSKGLEAERVFLLTPERFPLTMKNMTAEQIKQEDNLEYVAITRAKQTLVYLTTQKFLLKNVAPYYVSRTFEDAGAALMQPDVSPVGENLQLLAIVPEVAEVAPPTIVQGTPVPPVQPVSSTPIDETPVRILPPKEDVIKVPEFKASGNLTADMQGYRQNTEQRIFASLKKLNLKDALTLRELLDQVIEDLQAEKVG